MSMICVSDIYGIEVEGAQGGVWRRADSPFLVIGDIWIAPAAILRIQAGVEVIFQGNYALIDSGRLTAVGLNLEDESIRFRSEGSVWRGIRFVECDSTSILSFCEITGTETGVDVSNCSPTIEHSYIVARSIGIKCNQASPSIRDNELISVEGTTGTDANYKALSINDNSNPEIVNNKMIRCIADPGNAIGIEIDASSPVIRENWIEVNSRVATGINVNLTDDLFVYRNIIRTFSYNYNTGTGLKTDHSSVQFINNTIHLEGSGIVSAIGINIADDSDVQVLNNIILGNSTSTGLRGSANSVLADTSGFNCFYNHRNNYEGFFEPLMRDISEDPLFNTDRDSSYRLTWEDFDENFPEDSALKSPCIDAGYPSIDPLDPEHTPVDIGRFAFLYRFVDVNDDIIPNPEVFTLLDAYPNPFNSSLVVSYTTERPGLTTIKILNLNGKKVALLWDDLSSKGANHLYWNASGLPAGNYFLSMKTPYESQIMRITFLP